MRLCLFVPLPALASCLLTNRDQADVGLFHTFQQADHVEALDIKTAVRGLGRGFDLVLPKRNAKGGMRSCTRRSRGAMVSNGDEKKVKKRSA